MEEVEDFDPDYYDKVHKRFMQMLLSQGALTDSQAVKCLYFCLKASKIGNIAMETLPDVLKSVVATISNDSFVRTMKLGIEKITSEYDGVSTYYVLVNKKLDKHTIAFSTFKEIEAHFIKQLLLAIVQDPHGRVGTNECPYIVEIMNESNRPMAKKDAEVLVNRLHKEHWIVIKGDDIVLHPRAMAEMRPFFKDSIKDWSSCPLCNEIVILAAIGCDFVRLRFCAHFVPYKGQTCEKCDRRVHKYCVAAYAKQQHTDEVKCPWRECGEIWKAKRL